MQTSVGNIECLNMEFQNIIYMALADLEMENITKSWQAHDGKGDSPFSLCMRHIAGGPSYSPEFQREKFGKAAKECARASHDPRDLIPWYDGQAEKLGKAKHEIANVPTCNE